MTIPTRMKDGFKFSARRVGEEILDGQPFYLNIDTDIESLKKCCYYSGDAIIRQGMVGGYVLECKLVRIGEKQ